MTPTDARKDPDRFKRGMAVAVRVTPDEWRRVNDAAATKKQTVSEYMRDLLGLMK